MNQSEEVLRRVREVDERIARGRIESAERWAEIAHLRAKIARILNRPGDAGPRLR